MSDQIRHRSPKTQNNFFNNYYLKSPPKKDINIINFNNNSGVQSNDIKFNFRYSNTNNCYEEITKAFNFITFILKQKDSQIKELKIKIKELEKQLNDINETNIMTFNNKDIRDIYSDQEKNKSKNNLKRITYHYIPNKPSIFYSNNNSKNKNNNINNNENSNKIVNNSINIINRIKNSKNLNKINSYRNSTDLNNNNKLNYLSNTNNSNNSNNIINIYNNNNYLNTEENKRKININTNTNEYSNDKKNINIIRKEPYHTSLNNIKYRNNNVLNNINSKTNETDVSLVNDKIKIFNINTGHRLSSKNSRDNSFNLSEDGIIQSKAEIKNYLKEIKNKIDKDKFKKFVNLIKTLIKNKNSVQKNMIINEIKNILVDKNLITKFESILKIK